SHIREVNAIVQVVRCFENADIHHVSGTIDPIRDIEVINTELVLADLASLQKRHDRLQKEVRAGSKSAKTENLAPHLDAGNPEVTADLMPEEKAIARDFFLLTSKPSLFACNVAETELAVLSVAGEVDPGAAAGDRGYSARHVKAVEEYARNHFATEAVVISAQIESELVDLSETEAQEYLRGIGVQESGVGALIRAVYHLLGLRTYLSTGEKESRAWTIHAGDKAPQAAGVIHTDFERGFIAAEVVHYDD